MTNPLQCTLMTSLRTPNRSIFKLIFYKIDIDQELYHEQWCRLEATTGGVLLKNKMFLEFRNFAGKHLCY